MSAPLLAMLERVPDYSDSDIARFWSKVDKSGDCWLWTASVKGGSKSNPELRYGQFSIGSRRERRTVYAHAVSYHLAHGPIPDGLQVRHTCDVSKCVRPEHLIVGTHLDNMRDAAERGRLHVARPSRHLFTPEEIQDVRRLVREGPRGTAARIAAERGVSQTYISKLMRGRIRQFDAPLVWSE